jgi:hypothetical protein
MTRITDGYTAAATLQTLNEEQRLDKARLRLRKRRNALFRAAQRRELERAQQLRTRALAKRGIKKFSAKKPAKPHAQAHPHAAHHKLPLRREHIDPHRHLVARREPDQGQGRQQGGNDSNQQQQQGGEQQEREQGQSRDEEQQRITGARGANKAGERAPMRITAARTATALAETAVKPRPGEIQALVAGYGNPAQAEDAARQAYFNACSAACNEANQGLPSPPHPAEGLNDVQRRNLLLPLLLLHPEQRLEDVLGRLARIESVARRSPPIDKADGTGNANPSASRATKKFAESVRAAQIELLTAYAANGISPTTGFDEVKKHLHQTYPANAKSR